MQLVHPLNIKHLILPSSLNLPLEEQGWVEMDVTPTVVGDSVMSDVSPITAENPYQVIVPILLRRIKQWNMMDGATPLEITLDNIMLLKTTDVNFLFTSIERPDARPLTPPEKKT